MNELLLFTSDENNYMHLVCLAFMDTTTCFGCPRRMLKDNTSWIKIHNGTKD